MHACPRGTVSTNTLTCTVWLRIAQGRRVNIHPMQHYLKKSIKVCADKWVLRYVYGIVMICKFAKLTSTVNMQCYHHSGFNSCIETISFLTNLRSPLLCMITSYQWVFSAYYQKVWIEADILSTNLRKWTTLFKNMFREFFCRLQFWMIQSTKLKIHICIHFSVTTVCFVQSAFCYTP